MIPTYTTFIALFPEFNDLEETFVTLWLNRSAARVNKKTFGNTYEDAVYYLLGHKLSLHKLGLANGGEERGVLSSETEGDISASYSPVSSTMVSNNTNYTTTQYGREFLTLRNSKVKRFIGMGTPNVTNY